MLMPLWLITLIVGVASSIGGVLGSGASWVIHGRVTELRTELKDLRDDDIVEIKARIEGAAKSRKGIHTTMSSTYMQKDDCFRQQQHMQKSVDTLSERITEQSAMMGEIDRRTAATESVVKLIAGNMGIHIME